MSTAGPHRLHQLHQPIFCLFHTSNLSILSFRICLLMCPGSVLSSGGHGVAGSHGVTGRVPRRETGQGR